MSEDIEAVDPADTPVEDTNLLDNIQEVERPSGGEESTDQPDPADQSEDSDSGNREAAKYRRRLRDAEAERDRLTTRLENMQAPRLNA